MPNVKLFGNLRTIAQTANLEIPGETVQEIVMSLIARHPDLEGAILDSGNLRPYVRVMVSGRDVELTQGLLTPVSDDDEVAIFPPIAGGSMAWSPRS